MAQIIPAPSYENRSTLPFSTNTGVVLQHRSSLKFAIATALAVNDLIVLGTFKEGYRPVSVKADSDGIAALTADILLVDDIEQPTTTITVASGVSFVDDGIQDGVLTKAALRYKGLEMPMYLVAKVKAAANAAVGKEIGVTLSYRYRQSTD
ncbi:hypothetical protein [Acinetobacter ursingii]|uniref:hypothetical protein n=1 Tax=Acinetobacter ursingii TaxID=108980 RepID=UPI00124D632E|nr:hypothetical protein [Acinetobacter ursingii]